MEKANLNSSHSKEEIQPLHYLRVKGWDSACEQPGDPKVGMIRVGRCTGKVFPRKSLPRKQPTLLVVCGCEQNGAIGLACARHLRVFVWWDVETGSNDGISPDVLVSLAAPKQCATRFMGKHHLVAGRFLPYDVQKKFELNLPEYPGTECVVSL
ncbi:hypothetical protein JD844_034235 [Phrynosoma platyrhinos]|uniref:Uncharacterized protein n=1 Tax=Phrynosoma platyrhinos TaxID=52577 RepID=A0ABQ7T8X8_PHRPL|nr:hypothetical protein JD844_034235 [Phrynosoma platyrhinos]